MHNPWHGQKDMIPVYQPDRVREVNGRKMEGLETIVQEEFLFQRKKSEERGEWLENDDTFW